MHDRRYIGPNICTVVSELAQSCICQLSRWVHGEIFLNEIVAPVGLKATYIQPADIYQYYNIDESLSPIKTIDPPWEKLKHVQTRRLKQ